MTDLEKKVRALLMCTCDNAECGEVLQCYPADPEEQVAAILALIAAERAPLVEALRGFVQLFERVEFVDADSLASVLEDDDMVPTLLDAARRALGAGG